VLENVVSVAAELNGYPVSEFFTFFEEFECLLYDLFGNQISFEGYKSKSLNDLPIYFMAIPKDHPAANNPKAYYDLG